MKAINNYIKTLSLSSMIEASAEYIIRVFKEFGGIALLSWKTLLAIFKYKPNWKGILDQLHYIGNKSLSIVLLTALFTGMVLALQFTVGLARFGLKMYAGHIVGLAITRELGPVLTALMIAARVGSGITAELGSMVVTEQVMAIEAMGANPLQKLVVPRVVCTVFAAPLLVLAADFVGIMGGMIISVMEAGITPHFYLDQTWQTLEFEDIGHGVAKSVVFGLIVALIACYEGLKTKGGTEGVGKATTKTVVIASISIFIADFFLTKLFIKVM